MRVASSGSGGKDCKAGLEIWTEANTSQLENANKAKRAILKSAGFKDGEIQLAMKSGLTGNLGKGKKPNNIIKIDYKKYLDFAFRKFNLI